MAAAADFAAITTAYRHLYWTFPAADLSPLAAGHASFGASILSATADSARQVLATALSEVAVLAGRLAFFDLQEPEVAQPHFLRALQAAYEANDSLQGDAT